MLLNLKNTTGCPLLKKNFKIDKRDFVFALHPICSFCITWLSRRGGGLLLLDGCQRKSSQKCGHKQINKSVSGWSGFALYEREPLASAFAHYIRQRFIAMDRRFFVTGSWIILGFCAEIFIKRSGHGWRLRRKLSVYISRSHSLWNGSKPERLILVIINWNGRRLQHICCISVSKPINILATDFFFFKF